MSDGSLSHICQMVRSNDDMQIEDVELIACVSGVKSYFFRSLVRSEVRTIW